jgi:hypothetical protein
MAVVGMKTLTWVATVTAFKTKAVCCVHCDTAYLYDMKRRADASSSPVHEALSEEAKRQAQAGALINVDQKLDLEIDTVPCPSCGCYQPDMVDLLRRQYQRWMMGVGGALLVVAVAQFAASQLLVEKYQGPMSIAGTLALLPGVVLLALRSFLLHRYDPNGGDPQERIHLGQARAYRPEDADRIAEDRQNQRTADKRSREAEAHLTAATAWGIGASVLLLVGGGLAACGVMDLIHATSSSAWPKVAGKIHRQDRVVTRQRRVETVLGEVSFLYEVGERSYCGTKLWFGLFSADEKERRKYADGQQVQVYYDPSNPAVAVLQPGLKSPQSYTAGLLAALALGAGLFCVFLARGRYAEYVAAHHKVTHLHSKLWRAPAPLPGEEAPALP